MHYFDHAHLFIAWVFNNITSISAAIVAYKTHKEWRRDKKADLAVLTLGKFYAIEHTTRHF